MNPRFWKDVQLSDDQTILNKITIVLAEFFGIAILMIVGCLSCAYHDFNNPGTVLETAIGFGLGVLIPIQCIGHISGCHINPIITVAAVIRGVIPLINAPFYLLGQYIGGIVGYAIVRGITPIKHIYGKLNQHDGVCAAVIPPEITELQGVFLEGMISFILVTVACGVWDRRNANKMDSVALRFGFTISSLVFAAGNLTGAHMNPARTFGPSLINNYWKHQWIYWIGPFMGSFVASAVYTIFYT